MMMFLRYDEQVRALHRAAMPSYKALNLSGDTKHTNRRAEKAQKVEGLGRSSHLGHGDGASPLSNLKIGSGSAHSPGASDPADGSHLSAKLVASDPAGHNPAGTPAPPRVPATLSYDEICQEDGCDEPNHGSWSQRCPEHADEWYAFHFEGSDL